MVKDFDDYCTISFYRDDIDIVIGFIAVIVDLKIIPRFD